MRIFILDNFDLFTYNLSDEFEKRGCEVLIYRSDTDPKILDETIRKSKPQLLVLTSGPRSVRKNTDLIELIKVHSKKLPIFGINLGFHLLIEAFGGKVDRIFNINMGKQLKVEHDNGTIFNGIKNPMTAGVYHTHDATYVPYSFEISARTKKGTVMAVRHKESLIEAVQFHPESIITIDGGKIIDNLLGLLQKK